jgi:hypothetical protein
MVAEERRFKDFVERKLEKIKSNENFNKFSPICQLQTNRKAYIPSTGEDSRPALSYLGKL